MKFTTQYISDMISCAKSKLAAASTVAYRREYYGLYGLTDSLWHIHQLVLYLHLLERWNNSPGATNASTEEDLSHIFDRIIRMPYPCDLSLETSTQPTVNRPPIVNGGVDQNLSSGITSAVLAGTVVDPDNDSFTVVWTKISGGNVTINSPTSLITSLTNMQAGTYVFRLTAIDSNGNSASDDVTITIAQALDSIYYGRNDNGLPGSGLASYITSNGTLVHLDGSLDLNIGWHTGATGPQYCWVAIPDLSPAHEKNHWFVDIINQGNMGLPTDLFGEPQTVSIFSIDYLVWQTNYQTQFSTFCKLQKL